MSAREYRTQDDPNTKAIAMRMKQQRRTKRLTHREVSDALGVPLSTYSNWENCQNRISITDLARVAEVLETTTAYLLGVDPAAHSQAEQIRELCSGMTEAQRQSVLEYANFVMHGHRK